MKKIIMLLLLGICPSIFANDSWNEVFGGTLKMIDSENESIQMKNETVRITMYDDYYEVDATFYFYNHGEEITLKVGFPEGAYGVVSGYAELISFTTFNTYVNGQKQKNITFIENKEGQSQENWYVKDVLFTGNSFTETKVVYTAPYGQDFRIRYDFSTGYNWFGNIEESRFILINSSENWPMSYRIQDYDYEIPSYSSKGKIWSDDNKPGTSISEDFFVNRTSNGDIEVILKEVNPEDSAGMVFYICTEPFWDSWIFNEPYKVPYGFNKMVERDSDEFKSNLNLLSVEQLRILRNYFFASKNYAFNSEELTSYYTQYDWYEPQYSLSEITLSDNEKDIVNYIKELESYLSE